MLNELLNRRMTLESWRKIPWDDPDFSRRMLREHLSQAHDAASRRLAIIEKQVHFIHEKILGEKPARILDLGCGPGFYMHQLQQLGNHCDGIDFSPASIAYAREKHAGAYRLGDIRTEPYGEGYDLVMLIYGELNAFAPDEAESIIARAFAALRPGGVFLLEPSRYEAIEALGKSGRDWHTANGGLFSDAPYLCLEESAFIDSCAISHYHVIDLASGDLAHYVTMHQAYTITEFRQMLGAFKTIATYPSLAGADDGGGFIVFAAQRAR